jgi:hypothetical protein
MYQVLTEKIDNIYDFNENIELNDFNLKSDKKNIFVSSNTNTEQGIFNFNIELRVANDPNFRPIIPNEFKIKLFDINVGVIHQKKDLLLMK